MDTGRNFLGLCFDDTAHWFKRNQRFEFDILSQEVPPVLSISCMKDDIHWGEVELMLEELKRQGELQYHCLFQRGIITVPWPVDEGNQHAIQAAARTAGFYEFTQVSWPILSAASQNLHVESLNRGQSLNLIIFDLGNGNFKVTLLRIDNGRMMTMASKVDTGLSSKEFDRRLDEYFVRKLQTSRAKSKSTLYYYSLIQEQSEACSPTIREEELEDICEDMVINCMRIVKECMEEANITRIDDVILVGGLTIIPTVQKHLKTLVNEKDLHKSNIFEDPQARKTALQSHLSMLTNIDGLDSFRPEVAPLSIGVEIAGGEMKVVIPRNSIVPIKEECIFTTCRDYQTQVSIPVYIGQRPRTLDNKFLAKLQLYGITQARRGVPKIKITFDVDANGTLTVTAEDNGADIANNIIVRTTAYGRLSKEEIQNMVMDAQKHMEHDALVKEMFGAKNGLENFACDVWDKVMATHDWTSKKKIDKAVVEAIDWLHNINMDELPRLNDIQQIYDKYKELEGICGPIVSAALAWQANDDVDDTHMPGSSEGVVRVLWFREGGVSRDGDGAAL